jgi:hypothetical protein
MIDIAPVVALVTGFFASFNSNRITAIATAVSALFAGTIWWVNRRQLKHTRNVERAYISGGGPLAKDDPNTFIFTVNNYGKTPGVLTEYAVEFCPLNAIPSIPAYAKRGYKRQAFHDRIPPGGISERGRWRSSIFRRSRVRCSSMGATGLKTSGRSDTRPASF